MTDTSNQPLVCKCGGDTFLENSRANGWWRAVIDGYGNAVDTQLDGLRLSRPKTVICAECRRRYPNPLYGVS